MSENSLSRYSMMDLNTGSTRYHMSRIEICELLGVSKSVFRRHIESGRPIRGRYVIKHTSDVVDKSRNGRMQQWQIDFINEWHKIQKQFGVEVSA